MQSNDVLKFGEPTLEVWIRSFVLRSPPPHAFVAKIKNSTQNPQPSPHFSDEREGLRQSSVLIYVFAKAFDKWPEADFWHVGDQRVEHAALSEQGMVSVFGGVDLEMAIHAEAFAGGDVTG